MKARVKSKIMFLLVIGIFSFMPCLTMLDSSQAKHFIFMDGLKTRLKISGFSTSICTAPEDQKYHVMCSDGLGGAIIAWIDCRYNASGDIFAQRVNLNNGILWETNGVPICLAGGEQKNIQICSDGEGGAIISWQDDRYGYWDVFAQHVNSTGDLAWSLGGEIVSIAAGEREAVQMCSDSEGGAILTWQENRSGIRDIYAQRLMKDGIMNWSITGVPICTKDETQRTPQICSDGAKGAFITWRGFSTYGLALDNIYAQKINSTGDIQWTIDGIDICNESRNQYNQRMCNTENESAVITWNDDRLGGISITYAQRVDSNGTCWDVNGIGIGGEITSGGTPQICRHPGGTLIAWDGWLPWNDPGYTDIECRYLDYSGSVGGDIHVCLEDYDQFYVESCYNGVNGSILTWVDYREETESDIYAQLITSDMKKGWTASDNTGNGVPICTASSNQYSPQICSGGDGGAFIAWTDSRNLLDRDIYIQFVNYNGELHWVDDDGSEPPDFGVLILIGITVLVGVVLAIGISAIIISKRNE